MIWAGWGQIWLCLSLLLQCALGEPRATDSEHIFNNDASIVISKGGESSGRAKRQAGPFSDTDCNTNGPPCSWSINDASTPKFLAPLYIKKDTEFTDLRSYVFPGTTKDMVTVNYHDQIRFYCPGKDNSLVEPCSAREITLQCAGGSEWEDPTNTDLKLQFKDIKCSKKSLNITNAAYHSAGICPNNFPNSKLYNIGFQVEDKVFTTYSVCVDTQTYDTLYGEHLKLSQVIGNQAGSINKNFFQPEDIYTNLEPKTIENWYTNQKSTIEKLLGKKTVPEIEKNEVESLYFNKGHLSGKADFTYGNMKIQTFIFANTAPQWYKFNSGKWAKVEDQTRTCAENSPRNLKVLTGTHGIIKLENEAGTLTPLYLDPENGRMKIPEIFWKVIHDDNGVGIGIVMNNNPFLKNDENPEMICDKIDCGMKLTGEGFVYCCEVENLRAKVKEIPSNFPIVKDILDCSAICR